MNIIDIIKNFIKNIFNKKSNYLLNSSNLDLTINGTEPKNFRKNLKYDSSYNWKDPDTNEFPTIMYKDLDISYSLISVLRPSIFNKNYFYYDNQNKYVLRPDLTIDQLYNALDEITYLATAAVGEYVIGTDKSEEFSRKVGSKVDPSYRYANFLYNRADDNNNNSSKTNKQRAVETLENLLIDTTKFKLELFKEDELTKNENER